MREKTKRKDRFKQMCRVNNELLTLHHRLLDQGHGQAPAPRPPMKQGCSRRPVIRLHCPTAAQVSCHRNQHHHTHHQTATNKNCADSGNESQNHMVGLNHQLNTLYNQDFFVADTTGRRLSQIADKSNYPSLLPNGNAALQLRLPDLLIYLKTDTYLIDVKSGHHYAMHHNRIEKMSVLPKLYAAWPYRQLLQTIHDDAVRFGVNSPEPTTSRQSAPAIQPLSPIGHAGSTRMSAITVQAYDCQI